MYSLELSQRAQRFLDKENSIEEFSVSPNLMLSQICR